MLPAKKVMLSDLLNARKGATAIVIGGGPSAIDDYLSLDGQYNPSEAVLISANHHGHYVAPCHWTVCVDDVHTETKEKMAPALRRFGVPVIGLPFWSDIRINNFHPNVNSGLTAAYVAGVLGCKDIYLCGFGCYQDGTYFHNADAPNISLGRPVAEFYSAARKVATHLPDARLRPVSGPLLDADLLGAVGGDPRPEPLHSLLDYDKMYYVRFTRDCRHMGKVKVTKGEEHWLTSRETIVHTHRGNIHIMYEGAT